METTRLVPLINSTHISELLPLCVDLPHLPLFLLSRCWRWQFAARDGALILCLPSEQAHFSRIRGRLQLSSSLVYTSRIVTT